MKDNLKRLLNHGICSSEKNDRKYLKKKPVSSDEENTKEKTKSKSKKSKESKKSIHNANLRIADAIKTIAKKDKKLEPTKEVSTFKFHYV